ncbi:MAG TPA: acyltransferase [Thermoanaerobaculia bacterium]|nr:acyltransferase [Thermoanaerobaculia bacterium]
MNDEPGRIPSLDGLRAIAILLVMVFHFTRGHDTGVFWKITDIGWAGVDLFFVLSGYLITGILLRTKRSSHYFKNFYTRRALRILPLYYGTLALAFLVVPLLSGCPSVPFREQVPFWLYYANFARGGGSPCFVIGHFWSLGIEEQFYLLWPILLLRCDESTARKICCSVILISLGSRLALAMLGAPTQATFAWTFARLDGLAMGSLLALWSQSDTLRARVERVSGPVLLVCATVLMTVIALGGSTLVLDESGSVASIVARTAMPLLLGITFAALLMQSMTRPRLSRVLSFYGSRPIARYSYGAYVFHMLMMPALVLAFPRARLIAITRSNDTAVLLFAALGITATLAVAALSYHGFESFFLGLRSSHRTATVHLSVPANE